MAAEIESIIDSLVIQNLPTIDDSAMLEFVRMTCHNLAQEIGVKVGTNDGIYLPTSFNSLLLARKDGVPAGFLVWQEWQGSAFIGMAWVASELRHQGIYAHLVEVLKGIARVRGLKSVMAGVHGGNVASITAHQKIFGRPKVMYFEIAATDKGEQDDGGNSTTRIHSR